MITWFSLDHWAFHRVLSHLPGSFFHAILSAQMTKIPAVSHQISVFFSKRKTNKINKNWTFHKSLYAFRWFFNFFNRQECLKEPIDALENNSTDFTAFHFPKCFFSFLLAFGEISLEMKFIRWVSTLGQCSYDTAWTW